MKEFEWKCQECGLINQLSENELEVNDEFNCCNCGSLHAVELLGDDELYVEIY